jgi:hypothetical protein
MITQKRIAKKGWLKVFYIPCDLSKGEQAIFSYVAQYRRLRSTDNAIMDKDGEPTTAKDLLERCALKYDSHGQGIITSLKKRGILAKSKGILYLNPYIAYKGTAIATSTLKLFEFFRYGEEEIEGITTDDLPYEEVPTKPLEEIPLEELPF